MKRSVFEAARAREARISSSVRGKVRRGVMLSAVAICILVVLSAVPASPLSNAAAETETTLRIGMMEPIDSLNPLIGVNDNAYVFYGLVYDFLIAVDNDLTPKPNLAESWYIVPDQLPFGSVWQYNLTRNAKWHDGEIFDADDVVFTFDYQTGTNWTTVWAYQPYTILINYTEKMDDYTIRLHFMDFDGRPTACSFGESILVPILPEHIWRSVPVAEGAFSYPNKNPIGTGPLMVTDRIYDEFLSGNRITLMRNPYYHNEPVKFDRLILEFYLEPTAMVVDLERGAIDLAQLNAPTYKNLLDYIGSNQDSPIGTFAGLSCTSYSIDIGTCMNEFTGADTNTLRRDPAVLEAMALATNKEFIRDHIYLGYAEIGYSIMSPVYGDWYWQPGPGEEYTYDIDAANAKLDAAGYTWNTAHTLRLAADDNPYKGTKDGLTFQIVVELELPQDIVTAKFLQEEWAQVGIQLDIKLVDSGQWNSIVYGGSYDLCISYWSGDPDPNYIIYTQTEKALEGWSENWYFSPEYDENYTGSVLTLDMQERIDFVKNCEKLMYLDKAWIVTVYPYACYGWREDHFSGWGDWKEQPGRQLSNFWSANPLFFDLEPILTNVPPTVLLDSAAGFAGSSAQVTAYAWDPEGEAMTYYLEFGDGTNTTGDVPDDGEIAVSHVYALAGTFLTNLTVSDGTTAGAMRAYSAIVEPGSNAPPSNVRVRPKDMANVNTGSELEFIITAKDIDGDDLSVVLDYGDDTAFYETELTDTAEIVTHSAMHEFAQADDYDVYLNVSDGETWSAMLIILSVGTPSDDIDWMTYAIIGGIIAVIVVVAVVLVLRKKGGKKEEEDVRLP